MQDVYVIMLELSFVLTFGWGCLTGHLTNIHIFILGYLLYAGLLCFERGWS